MAEAWPGAAGRLDQAVLAGQFRIVGDEVCEPLVDQHYVGLDAPQPGQEDAPDNGLANLLELVAQPHLVVAELAAGGHQIGELAGQRIGAPVAQDWVEAVKTLSSVGLIGDKRAPDDYYVTGLTRPERYDSLAGK